METGADIKIVPQKDDFHYEIRLILLYRQNQN